MKENIFSYIIRPDKKMNSSRSLTEEKIQVKHRQRSNLDKSGCSLRQPKMSTSGRNNDTEGDVKQTRVRFSKQADENKTRISNEEIGNGDKRKLFYKNGRPSFT